MGLLLNDQSIRDLSNALLENRRITKLDFDFMGARKFETVEFFFHNLIDRGSKLQMKWLREIFMQLGKVEKIVTKNFSEDFDQVTYGKPQIVPPQDTVKLTYKNEENDDFDIFENARLDTNENTSSARNSANLSCAQSPMDCFSISEHLSQTSSQRSSHNNSNVLFPLKLELTKNGLPPPPMQFSPNLPNSNSGLPPPPSFGSMGSGFQHPTASAC